MEAISKYISFAQATWSDTAIRRGIINLPGSRELRAMKLLAEKVHTPICEKLFGGASVPFTSFYRSPKLNRVIGGAKTSQHVMGEAIDLDADGTSVSNAVLFYWILRNLEFDQLIAEYPKKGEPAWVHVSYTGKRTLRKEALIAVKKGGNTVYLPYIGNENLLSNGVRL